MPDEKVEVMHSINSVTEEFTNESQTNLFNKKLSI